ncbi:LuxR C-terminal-related transcriptional regulator [Arthrobacter sp. OY3WO11]|uniref:helix-turn-helix transcriptional regulator n=1 Tax=Arthrobacter sp. OY3WO11 TaxID=1835723 RepID=UPI0007CFF6DC|nr:LuxR C-terminal-related transcriptional regulator [Arthrobacter sp. OY3WO11]OAE01013.1 hypothetical protein A6A22_05895 [Arthrobacter sp. OY3WO11]
MDKQYVTWLEFLGTVLQEPLGMCPPYEEQLLDLLNQSFNGACSTRNVVAPTWDTRILACWPPRYIPDEPPGDFDYREQPLLRWYMLTGQREPQTLNRVPDALASNRLKQAWEELARPWNVNQQMSIPLQVGPDEQVSYLVSRPDLDFTEQELALAKLLQPILSGLALHFRFAPADPAACLQSSKQGLTLRERAILSLLSEGLTAESLGRRLNISPRTVEKHLQHIYRKLDVGDRLLAVQRAYELGLLTPKNGTRPNAEPRRFT